MSQGRRSCPAARQETVSAKCSHEVEPSWRFHPGPWIRVRCVAVGMTGMTVSTQSGRLCSKKLSVLSLRMLSCLCSSFWNLDVLRRTRHWTRRVPIGFGSEVPSCPIGVGVGCTVKRREDGPTIVPPLFLWSRSYGLPLRLYGLPKLVAEALRRLAAGQRPFGGLGHPANWASRGGLVRHGPDGPTLRKRRVDAAAKRRGRETRAEHW